MELDLLRKFDAKTNRVKGLAFHPHRPWILASLHNGAVQLYDYRMEILLESFEEHEGPVRGIDFHKTQPLFVSGGDDYKVKVWNYQNRRCLYTLHGHLDYIRTVYFHPNQYPWILSASDDQTVRIWNWQSRTCLLVLTGHNHYVMCAQWHPTEDLILSASLDQTIRVWDISGLRKRNTSIVADEMSIGGGGFGGGSLSFGGAKGMGSGLDSSGAGTSASASAAADPFGNIDAVVKFVLEGHSRGVNWASFHPTMSLVVSGADDREIKVWRMSGSRAWETTTYRGHLNNVSCALFHAKENVIISNSEDKTLRVWDISRNHAPLAFRRDNDRYWILAQHPRLNLLAAGHDNGMFIFKLSRERPAFYYMPNDAVYYFNEGYIRVYAINTGNDRALMPSRGSLSSSGGGGGGSHSSSSGMGGIGGIGGSEHSKRSKRPRLLYYNPYVHKSSKEVNILLFYDSVKETGDSAEYELYVMDKHGNNTSSNQRSAAQSIAFVTKNRFAVLTSDGEIILKNMDNISKKKMKIAERNVNYVFEGGLNRLILRSAEFMTLFDCKSRQIIRELQIATRFPVKFVHWDAPHYQRCALLAKFSVMICDAELNDICTIYENAKLKSGAWCSSGAVYIYTTVTHMKYALPSGDAGIIKTLDEVLYVVCIHGNTVTCMTRDWKIKKVEIDDTEFVFKRALSLKKFGTVKSIIEKDKLRGESILAYLQKKGYPEVALRFVQDPSTRFELAIECGNIEDAFQCAKEMNSETVWNRFAEAALMQGNYRYVTGAYTQTRNLEKLMNLFVINGNFAMLNKLKEIASTQSNTQMVFNIALLNGCERDDGQHVLTRIECLKEAQQYALAYLTANANGLREMAESIRAEFLADKEIKIPAHLQQAQRMKPLKVLYGPFEAADNAKYDWPQLPKVMDIFDVDDGGDGSKDATTTMTAAAAAARRDDDGDDDDEDEEEEDTRDAVDKVDMDDFGDEEEEDDDADGFGAEFKTKKSKKSRASTGGAVGSVNAFIGDVDDELEVSDLSDDDGKADAEDTQAMMMRSSSLVTMPENGKNSRQRWLDRAISATDMIAAGSFDLAQQALHRQFGIINFAPLAPYFMCVYNSCHAYVTVAPNARDMAMGIRRREQTQSQDHKKKENMANVCYSVSVCEDVLKSAFQFVTDAQFEKGIAEFRKILHIVPLLVIADSDELRDVRNLVKQCREYINALRVKEEATRVHDSDPPREFELNCYFTHFELQDAHIFSGLYGAMKLGYKAQYFKTTAVLCRRLLELAVSGKVRNDNAQKYLSQVQKVLKKCESKCAKNEYDNAKEEQLAYKAHDFSFLCCQSLTPIDRNEEIVKSPYCGSTFKAQFNGQISPVCNLVRIGDNKDGVTINTK